MAFSVSPRKQNFEYTDLLFHWRYGKDKEVDFVYSNGVGTERAIEVKFQNRISARDLDGLINFNRRTKRSDAILLSKDRLSQERECTVIPAAVFLLLA